MKIKIPKFKTIDLFEYNYFVKDDVVVLAHKERNCFIMNSDKEEVKLPAKHHIQLLKHDTEVRVFPKGKLFVLK